MALPLLSEQVKEAKIAASNRRNFGEISEYYLQSPVNCENIAKGSNPLMNQRSSTLNNFGQEQIMTTPGPQTMLQAQGRANRNNR